MDAENAGPGCAVCCCISIVVLIFMSFSSLTPLEFGITFNRLTYEFGETQPGGRYLLGPHRSFVVFPATAQSLDFSGRANSLRSRTSDGLEVNIDVSWQYRFRRVDVRPMYEKFGDNYEEVFRRLTIDTITRSATRYNSSFIFTQRTQVGAEFASLMTTVFAEQAHTEVRNFQLQNVGLPDAFEAAISQTETKRQDALKAIQEEVTKKVEGETLVKQAQQDQEGIRIRGEASATTIMLNNAAFVEQFNVTQTLAAESYQGVLAMLDSSAADLLEYLRMRAMRDHKPSNSIISLPHRNISGFPVPSTPGGEL